MLDMGGGGGGGAEILFFAAIVTAFFTKTIAWTSCFSKLSGQRDNNKNADIFRGTCHW